MYCIVYILSVTFIYINFGMALLTHPDTNGQDKRYARAKS